MIKNMMILVFIFVALTIADRSDASVSCALSGWGTPQTWDCTESQQSSTINYDWSVNPSSLGSFAKKHYLPDDQYDYTRFMQCNIQPSIIIDLDGDGNQDEGEEPMQTRYEGTVKVVRQYGVYTGPLSQSISEATVYCDSAGPTRLADEGEGLYDPTSPLEEIEGIMSSRTFSLCGPGGASDIDYGIGMVTVYCRGGTE